MPRRLAALVAVAALAQPATAQPATAPAIPLSAPSQPGVTGQSTGDDQAAADRAELIRAAVESAIDRLQQDVEALPLAEGLTVGQLLDRMPAAARQHLRQNLANSQQVGGPRFPSARVAQVELVARGERVGAALSELVRNQPIDPPVDRAALERRLAALRGRQFEATGTSLSPHLAERLRPETGPSGAAGWAGVPEEAQVTAIAAARANAVDQMMTAASNVVIGTVPARSEAAGGGEAGDGVAPEPPTLTLGTLFATGSLGEESRRWLAERPLTRIAFGDGRRVELKVAVEPADWIDHIRAGVQHQDLGLPPMTDEQWAAATADLAGRIRSARVGQAVVPEGPAAAQAMAAPADLRLPARPPEWARMPFSSRMRSASVQGDNPAAARLLARQAAEQLARDDLLRQLRAAAIADGRTLGELADARPEVDGILRRAVDRASLKNVSYRPDGDVQVLMSIDGTALWRALNSRR